MECISGISGTFNYMLVFQFDNILIAPSTCWELLVSSVVLCSPDAAGSLVTSSLVRETTENESQNYGYKFGQEEETYNIVTTEATSVVSSSNTLSFNNSRVFTSSITPVSLSVSGSLHWVFPRWPST